MLFVKMLKDLKENIAQFFAVFMMAFISLFVTAGLGTSAYENVDEYMRASNFKDLDVQGTIFSQNDIDDITMLEDITSVNGIYNTSGKIELDTEIKVLINYISGNDVSQMYVTEGSPYEEGASGVWISQNIAQVQGIKCGEVITINSNGYRFSEEVKGLVYSPQYIYYTVDSTFVEPDYSKYGFLIMDAVECPEKDWYYDELIIDVKDVGNSTVLSSQDNARLDRATGEIKTIISTESAVVNKKSQDYQLRTYIEAVGSNLAMQLVFPPLFGAIALLGILTTMTRLVARQRTTIGALKALGFTNAKIYVHYISYSFFVILAGSMLGAISGYYILGDIIYDSMVFYYLNPFEKMVLSGNIIIYMILLLAGGILVTYFSNRKVLSLSASSILQPEAPPSVKGSWYERMRFWSKLKFATQWNVRDISRNKFRTCMSIVGVLICSALIFASVSFLLSLLGRAGWQYGNIVKAKSKIEFESGTDYGVVEDYAREYSGQMIEEKSISFFMGDVVENTFLFVIDEGNNYILNDPKGNYMELNSNGVAISYKFANKIGAKVGDNIRYTITGEEQVYTERITAISRMPFGQGILMTRKHFEDKDGTFKPEVIYTNLTVSKDIEERNEIISVNTTKNLKEGISNSNDTYYLVAGIVAVLAIVLGSIILYNLGTMSYAEKLKDMATLKVLGFSSQELRLILMQQNLFITGIGTVLGIPLGYQILDILTEICGEKVDVLVTLSVFPYTVDVVVTFGLSVLINLIIVSKLKEIDMVQALKGV